MKWKSEFMKSATGQFGIYDNNELKKRITYYLDCLNDLSNAIEDNDVINQNWLHMHIDWLNEEIPIIYK